MHLKKCIIIPCALILVSAMQPGRYLDGARYEYSLLSLKNASPPEELKLITSNEGQLENLKVKKGVLFTYKNRKALRAKIGGDFNNWNPVAMKKGNYGVWYYFLADYAGSESVRYKFNVDNVWIADPVNTLQADDGAGSFVSLARVSAPDEGRSVTYRYIKENGKRIVEFRIYSPDASFVSVAGDFNSWNPENDVLRQGRDSIWRVKVQLPKGMYRYKYIIDGKWIPDTYNPHTASDDLGTVCSLIKLD
jgi:1,4-alpha-glucan branching enzyme